MKDLAFASRGENVGTAASLQYCVRKSAQRGPVLEFGSGCPTETLSSQGAHPLRICTPGGKAADPDLTDWYRGWFLPE